MTTEQRWTNAITKAVEIDGENAATYIGGGRFLVVSASDNGAYEVRFDSHSNTTCTCRAGELGLPCWHAATVRLVAGFAEAPQPEPAFDAAALGAFFANPQEIFAQ